MTRSPVQVFAAEHFVRSHAAWTCAGAPITDPRDGRLIGVVDVSGPLETMHPATLAWVDSVAKLAEARLRATRLPHPAVVVTASDVERGKPWPDPWLEGARRLGVDPADCLVVEDSVAGLRAARDSGCRGLVGVLGTTPREELEAVADVVLEDVSHLGAVVEGGRVRVLGD